MGFDKIWKHATKVGSGFCCKFCKETFEKGGPKQIKWHLARVDGVGVRACPVVSAEVIDEAMKALAPKRKSINDVLCLPAPPSSSRQSNIFDQIYDLMFDLVGKNTVILRLATAIIAYVRGNEVPEERTDGAAAIKFRYHEGTKVDSIDFKCMLQSYNHITVLLGIRGNLDAFWEYSEDVQRDTGSSKYREIVDFVISQSDFWSSCERIVRLLAPLVKFLVMLSVSGTTIGHVVRCFDIAMKQHSSITKEDECYGKLKDFYESGFSALTEAAAALDPSFVELHKGSEPGFRVTLGNFAQLYVVDKEKKQFMDDVEDYLTRSEKLYHPSALASSYERHPAKFWYWAGHGLPTLRSYALRVVLVQFGDHGDVAKHMSAVLEPDEEVVHLSGRKFVTYSNELGDAFNKKMSMSGEDYMDIWGKLKKLGQVAWDIVSQDQYDNFLLHIDGFLA